ncbi:hypothetical protein EDD86DRAFT_17852 [Gorgonomyces haynaldii]|nr:hypothetical protein EDD86DRAFT_17852 [Gorgonomyces haynaldii]
MFEKRSGDYLHPGAIFHGAGLYEGLCVVKLIATKLLKDKAPWKSPIFAVSFLAVLTCFVSQICYMFTIAFLERPWGGLDGWTQYYLVAKMVVVIPGFNSNLINIVILMRLAAFYAVSCLTLEDQCANALLGNALPWLLRSLDYRLLSRCLQHDRQSQFLARANLQSMAALQWHCPDYRSRDCSRWYPLILGPHCSLIEHVSSPVASRDGSQARWS